MNDTIRIRVPLTPDKHGLLGRQCPKKECKKYFKVKFGTGVRNSTTMFCPYCQYEGRVPNFITHEQRKYAKSVGLRKIAEELGRRLKPLESRSFDAGFFSFSFKFKPGTPVPIRRYVERELQQQIVCENCSCEYAIYGLFAACPDCGQQNLFQVAEGNLSLIERQVSLERDLHEKFGQDHKASLDEMLEGVAKRVLEGAYEDLVTTFETFFKEVNARHASSAADPSRTFSGNLFQRLDGTRDWFLDQFGFDILSPLSGQEVQHLRGLFNKRHILTHNLGLIDERYVGQAGLPAEMLGRQVEVSVGEAKAGIEAVRKLVQHLRARFT